MTIRTLKEEDYDFIIARLNDWWGGRNMSDMLPRLFIKYFSDTCFAAEEDGAIIGFVIGFFSQNDDVTAYIHFAGVDPGYRRKKVAHELYNKFFEVAAQYGRTKIGCVTSTVNKLSLAFHTGVGFSIKENDLKLDNVSYFKDYDGAGEDRYVFELKNPLFNIDN